MHWHTQTQKLTRAKYLLPVRFKVFHWDLLQHQGHPCSWCIFPSGQLRVLGCAPNSSGSWRPAACSTCTWSCRRCCTAPASTEEVKACLCHSDHVPKVLLQKYSPRQQTEPALEGSPSLCPWVGGRALLLVALPHTTDTAQPHRWLCHLSVHIKNHSTRGPTQPSVALTCVITGSTQPFFLNYFQLQDKCRKKSWTAFKMIM